MNKHFIDSFIKIARYPVAVSTVFLGIVLIVPEGAANRLGIADFRKEYALFLGPAFLLVISIILVRVIATISNGWFASFRRTANEKKAIKSLSSHEKSLLMQMIRSETKTTTASIQEGVVGGLVAQGLMYRASNVGWSGLDMKFDFNLQPWVWDRLQKNPELVMDIKEDDSSSITQIQRYQGNAA